MLIINSKWKVREPIDIKKKEMMFIILDSLKIPYTTAIRYQVIYEYIGVSSDKPSSYGRLSVIGLGNPNKKLWPHTSNFEVGIDEVLETLVEEVKKLSYED